MSERRPDAYGLTSSFRERRGLPDDGVSGVPLKPRAATFACARCGEKPRLLDTFLCVDCHADPLRVAETYAAQAGSDDAKEQRRLLIANAGWAGWSRRLKGAPRA